jgi:hypothetical protein
MQKKFKRTEDDKKQKRKIKNDIKNQKIVNE